MPLCQSCENINIHKEWVSGKYFPEHPLSLDHVLQKAASCEFCSLLCKQFESYLANIIGPEWRNTSLSSWQIMLFLDGPRRQGDQEPPTRYSNLHAQLSDDPWRIRAEEGRSFHTSYEEGSTLHSVAPRMDWYGPHDSKRDQHFKEVVLRLAASQGIQILIQHKL